ncbi:MAG: hypothetical protein QM493_03590, partial [Sulfurovum sp.]
MSSKRYRKRALNAKHKQEQKDNGYFELSSKPIYIEKYKRFQNTLNLKDKIIDCFNKNKETKAQTYLKYLRENQEDEYLIKSLSDISTKLFFNQHKLIVLKMAYGLNHYDKVTLTSYATALASNSEYKKAFVLFDKSLEIDSKNSVTLTSYATA